MANFNELERLGERFPNKNVGCGNPDSKISLAQKTSLTSAIMLFTMKNY